ncbi:MAG: IS3 family transposase [Deinococcus sp.]
MVSVRRLCELHDVSRSWYVHQQGREAVDQDQQLAEDIEAVVLKWSGYGYRRVTHELARRGRPANHKRVLPNGSGEARPSTGHAGTSSAVQDQTAVPDHHRLRAQRGPVPQPAATRHPE